MRACVYACVRVCVRVCARACVCRCAAGARLGAHKWRAPACACSTHLYGRRLVVEWANPDDDVDALREKAERDVRRTEGSAPKRARHGRDDGLSMPGEVWEA